MRQIAVMTAILLIAASTTMSSAACDMHLIARHADLARTRIYAASGGVASIYFKTDMDVNTDGTARSYHPDDPRGRTLAFNNMGNAITKIFNASGQNITCSPRQGACFTRFMETFEAARNAKYNPNGHPRIETSGIIPWKMDSALGRKVPCTIESGVFKGYFVSQTSIAVDPTKDVCDQGRYLDSFLFNATVLPRAVTWSSQGTRTDDGDLVVVKDRDNGRIAFAINGDRGPANRIGEGTIALTAALSGRTLQGDEPFNELKRLARRNVQYVIFPKDDIRRKVGPAFTQADIDRVGKEIFEQWGGVARLDDCAALD